MMEEIFNWSPELGVRLQHVRSAVVVKGIARRVSDRLVHRIGAIGEPRRSRIPIASMDLAVAGVFRATDDDRADRFGRARHPLYAPRPDARIPPPIAAPVRTDVGDRRGVRRERRVG